MIYKAFERFKKLHNEDWESIRKDAQKWYRDLADSNPAKDHKHYNCMDERGIYSPQNIAGPNYGQYRYEVLHPKTGKPVKEPASGWRYPRETMIKRIEDDLIVFGADESTVPKNKVYLHDNETQGLTSVKYKDGRSATKALIQLLKGDFFTNPKDVDIISTLIESVTEQNSVILDFFSGSGTTAEAVFKLNSQSNGNLKFILVQLPEEINPNSKSITSRNAYQAGYFTIDAIGRDRITKAADKIKCETGTEVDFGFKLHRLETPSGDVIDTLNNFDPETEETLFAGDYLSKFEINGTLGHDTVLTTWMAQDGYGLTRSAQKRKLVDYHLDICDDTAYIIEPGLSSSDVVELVRLIENGELNVARVVVFGYSVTFGVMHELKKNLSVLKSGRTVSVMERL